MIISRTPLRISLGGGGTDIPLFYEKFGHGFLVAAAISKYIYIAVNRNFDDGVLLKYSEIERVATSANVTHPLFRECLRFEQIEKGIEISSMADIPTGTGLGSSGSFAVGLIKALNFYNHGSYSDEQIARIACEIEIKKLGEPVGKQDQYIAAIGGITSFTFHANGDVKADRLSLSASTRTSLEENLLLFNTGFRRSAGEVLGQERRQHVSRPQSLEENLMAVRDLGYRTRDALIANDLESFGRTLTEQWKMKLERQPSAIHEQIDRWILDGIQAGASGGKLVGAGGGGFLLFYADRKAGLRAKMAELGLDEVVFGIDYEGTSLVVVR